MNLIYCSWEEFAIGPKDIPIKLEDMLNMTKSKTLKGFLGPQKINRFRKRLSEQGLRENKLNR